MNVIVNLHTRPIIISNLEEAVSSACRLRVDLQENRLYSMGRFSVEMGHIFSHVNFAWNIRGLKDLEQYRSMSEENFYKWTSFPKEQFYWSQP